MGNHYQLLLETPEANRVAGMKWLPVSHRNDIHNSGLDPFMSGSRAQLSGGLGSAVKSEIRRA